MRRALACAVLLLAAGCGKLPATNDGIVALELLTPKVLTVTPEGTLTLRARALNQNGDSVEAAIRWTTVDTLVITLDPVSGLVTPIAETGSARVQAAVGTLRSDPVVITIKAATP